MFYVSPNVSFHLSSHFVTVRLWLRVAFRDSQNAYATILRNRDRKRVSAQTTLRSNDFFLFLYFFFGFWFATKLPKMNGWWIYSARPRYEFLASKRRSFQQISRPLARNIFQSLFPKRDKQTSSLSRWDKERQETWIAILFSAFRKGEKIVLQR